MKTNELLNEATEADLEAAKQAYMNAKARWDHRDGNDGTPQRKREAEKLADLRQKWQELENELNPKPVAKPVERKPIVNKVRWRFKSSPEKLEAAEQFAQENPEFSLEQISDTMHSLSAVSSDETRQKIQTFLKSR